MLVGEFRRRMLAARESSSVMVFVRRPGVNRPNVAEDVEVLDVPTADALVVYVEIGK